MSVRFDVSDAVRQLNDTQQRTLYACLSYGKASANKMVKYAKQHRPWTDRTHLAKNSINGGARQFSSGRVRIELAHGVKYGVYLELVNFRHKGSLAIIEPTVQKLAPEIVRGWAQIVQKGGR